MLNSWPLAKDLQVLVEIVHSGSFSAAAATLGQTPAFVTKRIQILENTLATTLLNRSARGVALTESGQRCYEHALEILTQYQRLVDDVTQIKTRPEGDDSYWLQFWFWAQPYCASYYRTDAQLS